MLVLLVPAFTHAATTSNLNGCIHTSQYDEEGIVYIRLTAPSCTFTLQLDSDEESPQVYIQNADPYTYSIYGSSGREYQPSINNSDQLQFTPTISPGARGTYTIKPWTNDHQLQGDDSTDFWFAALADTQTQPGGSDPNPIFVNIAEHVNTLSVPFVTISGDLIGGHVASEEEHEAMYDRYDTVIDSLATPVFSVPGDHDTRQSLDEYYTPRYGERFFRFEYQDVSFVGINSVEDLDAEGEFTSDDLVTVEALLSDAQDSTQTIVYMHHPLIPPDWASSQGVAEEQRLTLGELFVEYGVDLILVGDAHGYDDNIISSEDLPGLTGEFRQLTIGGSGGNMANYDGEHFYMLLHVTEDGIAYERIDYSTLGLTYEFGADNNGTQATIPVTVTNTSTEPVPLARISFHVNSPYAYAVDQNGTFYNITTHTEPDDTVRGYIDTTMPAESEYIFTVGEQTEVLVGATQTVQTNGALTYAEQPSGTHTVTTLSVEETDESFTIIGNNWDAENNIYEWSTTATHEATATYTITDLQPHRWYSVFRGNTVYKRFATDSDGTGTFQTVESGSAAYSLGVGDIVRSAIGALPATYGGAQFRAITEGDRDIHAFFAYSETKERSAESVWADLDGDNELELVTYPAPGESVALRVYETDGTRLDGVYPFGREYDDGYSVAVGDVNADGDQEIAVTRLGNKKSIVRIFDLQNSELIKIDQFRAFGTGYKGGVSLAMADINDDGDAEIITGTRDGRSVLRVYKWRPVKADAALWFQRKPMAGVNAEHGLTLAAADMNADGREDVVLGSVTGNSMVKVYAYNRKGKFKKIGQRHTFSKKMLGGVRLATGNVKSDAKEEVLVTPAGSVKYTGQVRAYQLNTSSKKLKSVGRKAPFGTGVAGGVHMATADVDDDSIEEIGVSRLQDSGLIYMLGYESGGLSKIETYRPYSTDFAGGLYLTQ